MMNLEQNRAGAAASVGYGMLALLLSACGGGTSGGTSPQASASSGASLLSHTSQVSTTRIIAEHSGHCLDVRGGTAAVQDGALIEQWSCTGQANQDWTLVPNGSSYAIRASSSGKCIEPVGGGTANETRIQQSTCNGSANQLWNVRPKPTGRYEIVHTVASRCLDVIGGPAATQEGVLTELWDCTGQENQSWALTLPGTIVPTTATAKPIIAKHSNKCLDVRGGPAAVQDGALIEQWSCTGEANQDWTIRVVGNGFVELIARSSGKCLDVREANPANEAVIQQWTCNGQLNQWWRMEPLSNRGEYRFTTALSGGRCLDVRGGTAATGDGALMELWDCTGQDNQTWTIGGDAPSPDEQGDGVGTAARFSGASGIARDAAGNLIVADRGHHTIRRVAPNGTVTTVAGAAGQPGYVDAQGSAARFFLPMEVAVDRAGNIYVVEDASKAIRKISPTGVVTTLAGSFTQAGNADGMGESARFTSLRHLVIDSAENVLVTDTRIPDQYYLSTVIRKITPDGVVSTHPSPPDISPNVPFLQRVTGLAIDAQNNLYVPDLDGYVGPGSGGARGWGVIHRISPTGEVTYAGGGGGNQIDGGLYEMSNLTVDSTGRVLVFSDGRIVLEGSSGRIRNPGIYIPEQRGGTLVAGITRFGLGDLVTDGAGNIYVTNSSGVLRIGPDGSTAMVAGTAPVVN